MTLTMLKNFLKEFADEKCVEVKIMDDDEDGNIYYDLIYITYVTGTGVFDKPTLIIHCKSENEEVKER